MLIAEHVGLMDAPQSPQTSLSLRLQTLNDFLNRTKPPVGDDWIVVRTDDPGSSTSLGVSPDLKLVIMSSRYFSDLSAAVGSALPQIDIPSMGAGTDLVARVAHANEFVENGKIVTAQGTVAQVRGTVQQAIANLTGVAAPPATTSSTQPFYKKPLFWGAIAGGVAVVAATSAAVLHHRRKHA